MLLLGLVNFIFMFISKNYCAKIIMVVLDFINSASGKDNIFSKDIISI